MSPWVRSLAGALFFAGSLVLTPSITRAQICDQLLECCLQVVDAHVERGLSGIRLTQALQTCRVHEGLAASPGVQQVFCIESYYIVSQSAWEDFQAGRIGFYPESCNPDPTLDPDEVLAPPLDEMDPEPEVEE